MKMLRFLFDRKLQAYPFRPPKKYKPTKQEIWCTKNLHGSMWKRGCLDYTELTNILLRDVKGEYSARDQKKAKFLAFYWIKGWKTWMIMATRNFESLLTLKQTNNIRFGPVTHSEKKPQCTLRRAERKVKLLGTWAMQPSKL